MRKPTCVQLCCFSHQNFGSLHEPLWPDGFYAYQLNFLLLAISEIIWKSSNKIATEMKKQIALESIFLKSHELTSKILILDGSISSLHPY